MSQSCQNRSNRAGRGVSASVMLILFTNLIACTEYTPVRGDIDASHQPEVRVTLTDQGQVDVAPRIGLRATKLEGILQSMSDSSLSLSVRKVSREGGIEDYYPGENLSLVARDFDAVEKSRTSVARSVLLTGAIVIASFLAAKGAGSLTGSENGSKPPPTR